MTSNKTEAITRGDRSVLPVRRSTFACAVLAGALMFPAGAAAGESLLSGYGGPGGGEQTLLGGKLLPPANGAGSLRALPSPTASAPRLTARPGQPTAAVGTRASNGLAGRGSRTASRDLRDRSGSGTAKRGPQQAAGSAPVAARTGSRPVADVAIGLPFAPRDLLLLGLLAAAILLTAVAVRRLARDGPVDVAG